MADKIQFRGDTRAKWLEVDPILSEREFAIETDTRQFKIGDGVLKYSELEYGGLAGADGADGADGNGAGNIILLPYIEPIFGANDPTPTNAAEIITAWNPLIKQYLSAPNISDLKMELPVSLGEAINVKLDCQLLMMDDTQPEGLMYMLTGVAIMPLQTSQAGFSILKSQAIVMLVIDNNENVTNLGYMLLEPMITATGSHNSLCDGSGGGGGALFVYLDISNIDTNNQEQLNAICHNVITAIRANPKTQVVYVNDDVVMPMQVLLTTVDSGNGAEYRYTFLATTIMATGGDCLGISTSIYCEHHNGVTSLASYSPPSYIQLATSNDTKRDYSSLTEQEVLGEFWLGLDGSKKQVYCQSFTGTVDSSMSTPILTGVEYAMPITGYVSVEPYRYVIGTSGGDGFLLICSDGGVYISQNADTANALPYVLTLKYIKQ